MPLDIFLDKKDKMKNYQPEIAIIDYNSLACIGLKSILEKIIPAATIRTFLNFADFMNDTPDMYAHYFVSTSIFIEHNTFFLEKGRRAILLSTESQPIQSSGLSYININQTEEQLVKSLLQLHHAAHHHEHIQKHSSTSYDVDLTPREIEVLVLITKGLINKEIAKKLSISLNTVITHRKNIVDKLGIRSVSGLTIYAVMNGYIEADQI